MMPFLTGAYAPSVPMVFEQLATGANKNCEGHQKKYPCRCFLIQGLYSEPVKISIASVIRLRGAGAE